MEPQPQSITKEQMREYLKLVNDTIDVAKEITEILEAIEIMRAESTRANGEQETAQS